MSRLLLMGALGRIGYGFAATLVVALGPAPALARADEPSSPDPTVMDVVDSVLADSPHSVVDPAAQTQPAPPPPGT